MVGALYVSVISEPLYTGDVRSRVIIADPNTVKDVTGFKTPSTFTSKLDSAGGLVVST
jgi:hypothetical protein